MTHPLTSISRHTPATMQIASGQSVDLRVEDWCHGRLSADPATYVAMLQPRCPIAGPIDLETAQIGDHLSVLIEEISLDARGTAARIKNAGPLPPADEQTRVWDVTRQSGLVELAGLRFAEAPMIGIIGTRPDSVEEIGTRHTGAYGGNLDTKEITVGARVELPILTSGGGLFVGDLHAAMGDGELTATGCEFGGNVKLRIDLIRGQTIDGPRLRFGNRWATLATSNDFPHACREATDAMHRWIIGERRLGNDAAAFVIGMAGGVGISQVVNPSGPTVKVIVDWDRVIGWTTDR